MALKKSYWKTIKKSISSPESTTNVTSLLSACWFRYPYSSLSSVTCQTSIILCILTKNIFFFKILQTFFFLNELIIRRGKSVKTVSYGGVKYQFRFAEIFPVYKSQNQFEIQYFLFINNVYCFCVFLILFHCLLQSINVLPGDPRKCP